MFTLPTVSIHLQPPRGGQLLYKGQKKENLYCPQGVLCSEIPLNSKQRSKLYFGLKAG